MRYVTYESVPRQVVAGYPAFVLRQYHRDPSTGVRTTNELLKASSSSARSIDTQLETYLIHFDRDICYRLAKFSISACVPRGTNAGRINDLNFSKNLV